MIGTVLVPLDGSEKDERVLPVAAAVAELADGDLHLVHVLTPPLASLSERAQRMGGLDAARESRREMEQRMQYSADSLTSHTGRRVTVEITEAFDVADALVRRSAGAVSFVVMATRGAGVIGRTVCGSVADRVIRESSRPVVVAPPRAADRRLTPFQLRRVLVPLDGSELSLGIVDHLLGLERTPDLEHVLLEVVTSGFIPEWAADSLAVQPDGRPLVFAHERAEAETRLNEVATRLRSHGLTVVGVRVAVAREAAPEIVRAASRERADLIAMSIRGARGLRRFMLGSVSEQLLRASEVPVLLVASRDQVDDR